MNFVLTVHPNTTTLSRLPNIYLTAEDAEKNGLNAEKSNFKCFLKKA
jgi:hypothetical protein